MRWSFHVGNTLDKKVVLISATASSFLALWTVPVHIEVPESEDFGFLGVLFVCLFYFIFF